MPGSCERCGGHDFEVVFLGSHRDKHHKCKYCGALKDALDEHSVETSESTQRIGPDGERILHHKRVVRTRRDLPKGSPVRTPGFSGELDASGLPPEVLSIIREKLGENLPGARVIQVRGAGSEERELSPDEVAQLHDEFGQNLGGGTLETSQLLSQRSVEVVRHPPVEFTVSRRPRAGLTRSSTSKGMAIAFAFVAGLLVALLAVALNF